MEKTLLFSDAHRATKNAYQSLLEVAINEKIKNIMFLGDIDGSIGYNEFINFIGYASISGIKVGAVKGNHDQAWHNYAAGLEDKCKVAANDPTLKKDRRAKRFLRGLSITERVEDILYTHAFPRGKRFSGPQGNKKIHDDHRRKYRELWHYSFGTNNTQGTGMNAYDPDVLNWNFREVLGTKSYLSRFLKWVFRVKTPNYMIKGHEHSSKVWNYDPRSKTVSGGRQLDPGTRITVDPKAIVQVASFDDGHYAIIEKDKKQLKVYFKQLAPHQM